MRGVLIYLLSFFLIFAMFGCDDDDSKEDPKVDDIVIDLYESEVLTDGVMLSSLGDFAEVADLYLQLKKSPPPSPRAEQECTETAIFRDARFMEQDGKVVLKITYCNQASRNGFATLNGIVYMRRGETQGSFDLWTGSDGLSYKTTALFKTIYTEALTGAFSEFNLDDCSKETDLEKRAKCEAIKVTLDKLLAEDYASYSGAIKIADKNPGNLAIAEDATLGKSVALSGDFDVMLCPEGKPCTGGIYNIAPATKLMWKLPMATTCNCPLSGKITVPPSENGYAHEKYITFKSSCDPVKDCCGQAEVTFKDFDARCKTLIDAWTAAEEAGGGIGGDECANDDSCTDPVKKKCFDPSNPALPSKCVECIEDTDCCPENQSCEDTCNTLYQCQPPVDEGCSESNPCDTGKYCKEIEGIPNICVACLEDAHCNDDTKMCNDYGVCVEKNTCESDDQCTGDKKVCDTDKKKCVVCTESKGCADGEKCIGGQCISTSLPDKDTECLKEYTHMKTAEGFLKEACPIKPGK